MLLGKAIIGALFIMVAFGSEPPVPPEYLLNFDSFQGFQNVLDTFLADQEHTPQVVVERVADQWPADQGSLEIAATGDKHFCFPGSACDYNLRHDGCDTHCRNHTFQIGACSKVYHASGTGSVDYDYLCCCYGTPLAKDL